MYRYDVGFSKEDDPADTRLITVNDSTPNLVIPIGGQLRTVLDWWMARGAGTLSLGTWLPVADPDRADVPLYIEFTAQHGRKFVAPGTAITAPDLAYVPYLFMHTSDDSRPRVNTQFMWVRSLPPQCFCTTVPIVFSVVGGVPKENVLYFNLREMQARYGWQAVANAAADLIVEQLDAGVDAAELQYSLPPSRDQTLPWAYGPTPAPLCPPSSSTDAPVTRATTGEKSWSAADFAHPTVRGPTSSRVSKKKKVAACAVSSRDELTVSWTDAVEKDGITIHPAYALYSSYEDKLDTKRTAAVKRDWWKAILVQLEANGGVVTAIMDERLARYTQSARSTEARKNYGDRRRTSA